MSSSIAYLTSRANFLQVSPDVPITKERPVEKYDTPEVFEGAVPMYVCSTLVLTGWWCVENKKELVTDLMTKAKQIEYLINSLPQPEPEEVQVRTLSRSSVIIGADGLAGTTFGSS